MSRPRADLNRTSAAGVVPTVTVMAVLGLTGWYVFHKPADIAPGPVELSRLSSRRVQHAVAMNGIAGGASAGLKALAAAEPSAPPPERLAVRVSAATAYCLGPVADVAVARGDATHRPPAIRLSGVTNATLHRTREEAVTDALGRAREKLGEVFAALRSPIREVPDEEELRQSHVEWETVTVQPLGDADREAIKAEGLDGDWVRVRLAVTVSEEQLRQLRARQRLYDLSRWAAAALAVLAIAYGALRAEDRSQGYLTWLWAGVAAVLVGAVVTLAVVL